MGTCGCVCQEGARCPLCRSPFSISQLVEVPPEELDGEDNGAHGEGWRTSSKVRPSVLRPAHLLPPTHHCRGMNGSCVSDTLGTF